MLVTTRLRRVDGDRIDPIYADVVHVTEQLLGEDLSVDTHTCDEVIDAIQAIHAGRATSVDFAWDATQLVVAGGSSRVRPAARAGSVAWVEVPTRELYDALLELRAFIAGS